MSSVHYLRTHRATRAAIERDAYLRVRNQPAARHAPPRTAQGAGKPVTRWQLAAFWTGWLLAMAGGLWLAAHDPLTLHQLVMRLLGETPA